MPDILPVKIHDPVQESDLTIAGGHAYSKVGGNTKTVLSVAINFNTAATHEIIAADATNKIKIISYDLVVGGETNITLKHGATAFSGPYDYGGTNEPRGLVRNFPSNYPLETAINEAFNITNSAAVQVSGLVQYYKEA
jgi:hypothetical protein